VIPFGSTSLDEPRGLEHVEMMSEEIARHSGQFRELSDRVIAQRQMISDVKTARVSEGSMSTGSPGEIHKSNYIDSIFIEQICVVLHCAHMRAHRA
jgi:hypothetical protein